MGADLRRLLRAGPGGVELAAVDPRSRPGLTAEQGKQWARERRSELGRELARQQEMLFASAKTAAPGSAAARRRVLLVLQGMDCSGKGGTVRRVVGAMNPIGLRVTAFGPPTEQERERHFLWRVARALPSAGQVGVFDRSHYEDVLIARVRQLVPESVWRGRYDEINQWESELVAGGVTIVKVMLHLSYREQTERLAARLANPAKHWKLDPSDLDERTRWGDYQEAYAELLARCSTDAAPWYVVPADRKWYRDWAVTELLLATCRDLGLRYPPATVDVAEFQRRLAATAQWGTGPGKG
ncbi:PPK2 family polyphosphate kinase [Natronosporangium hydrolyticum]|nr:PPK2 family polyphosphate kinase [Natronosporangium hydrolyticum]